MRFFLDWGLKKKINTNLNALTLFFSILFLISGCEKPIPPSKIDLTSEEAIWMEQFFTGLLLQNRGIYTLCGSKPITCITLNYYTDEEIQAYYDQMTEEEKKTAVYVEDYQLAQNWEKWEKVRSRFPIQRYLLYKKQDTTSPKCAQVYFVDPKKVAETLSKNYTAFRDVTGFDFDPLQEAHLIEKGSPFWSKVKDHPVIYGLLFGFGLKNSLVFYWKNWGMTEKCQQFPDIMEPFVSDSLIDGKSTIENLKLPAFMSFFKNDEVIESYKKEREAIQEEYRGKKFLFYSLQKLTSR